MPILLPAAAALCLGTALVTSKFGLLAGMDARRGAATSVPSAALMFIVAAPWWLDTAGFSWAAVGAFALVGMFFPAAVTLLNFSSTHRIGPALTGSISGTSPLFSLLAAWLLLGEAPPARALTATLGVMAGVVLISWQRGAADRRISPADLSMAAAGAAIRGTALVLGKLAMTLWHSPLCAVLVGYCASACVLIAVDRSRRSGAAPAVDGRARAFFIVTGLLNGLALFSMYQALESLPVSIVAPVVAAYPLVTLALGAFVLRADRLSPPRVLGAITIALSIVWLVG